MYNYRDIDENKIFSNGGLNLHIVWIAQRRQSGIIRILKEYTSVVYSKNTLYGLQCTLIGPCHRTKSDTLFGVILSSISIHVGHRDTLRYWWLFKHVIYCFTCTFVFKCV